MTHFVAANAGQSRAGLFQWNIAVPGALAVFAAATAMSPFVPAFIRENDLLFHILVWFVLTVAFLKTGASVPILAAMLTGSSIALELGQIFVPHREFSMSDIAANQIAIASGLAAISWYRTRKRKRNDTQDETRRSAPVTSYPSLTATSPSLSNAYATVIQSGQRANAGAGYCGIATRLLLYYTILASSFVFIEPSPYEGLALLLAALVLTQVRTLHLSMIPLFVFMFVWAIGALLAAMPAVHDSDAMMALSTSAYLWFTSIIFAFAFSQDVMRRLATLRAAYIFTAALIALVGSAAYFGIVPGSELLLENGRVRSTFKDPNVFGPYLILPLLLIVQSLLQGRIRLGYLVALPLLLAGLLLSFSRGAWGHFIFSAIIMVGLMIVTEESGKRKARILLGVSIAGVTITSLSLGLLQLDAVQDMFEERAALIQPYDAGRGGRFTVLAQAIDKSIEHPQGMGPLQFEKELLKTTFFGVAPHNSYINALLSYGWLGGLAYICLVLATALRGFYAVIQKTPWQPIFIACYATFLGLAAEGLIIHTNHWRHFYLLVGIIWGLTVATARHRATAASPSVLN